MGRDGFLGDQNRAGARGQFADQIVEVGADVGGQAGGVERLAGQRRILAAGREHQDAFVASVLTRGRHGGLRRGPRPYP